MEVGSDAASIRPGLWNRTPQADDDGPRAKTASCGWPFCSPPACCSSLMRGALTIATVFGIVVSDAAPGWSAAGRGTAVPLHHRWTTVTAQTTSRHFRLGLAADFACAARTSYWRQYLLVSFAQPARYSSATAALRGQDTSGISTRADQLFRR